MPAGWYGPLATLPDTHLDTHTHIMIMMLLMMRMMMVMMMMMMMMKGLCLEGKRDLK